jgi:uncharacterized protein YbjT (DUF2867 family)
VNRPVITVFGSTGAQGCGLVRAILADPVRRFSVRAITRTPDSEAARALATRGAHVVRADLDDPSSLRRALEGAHGVFAVTNFWEHLSAGRELLQAANVAAAAAAAGVRHLVWSTLEDTRTFLAPGSGRMPVLQGRYNVPHFDAKGEANRFFAEHGIPTTLLYTSCYWENLIHFGLGPKPRPDGTWAVTFPTSDRKIPWISVEDIGRSAFAIFSAGDGLVGQSVGVAGEHLTGDELAAELGRALGRSVVYDAISPDAYRALGFPGAEELGNMFQFKRDFADQYRATRDMARARQLLPTVQTFGQWLEANARRIPLC